MHFDSIGNLFQNGDVVLYNNAFSTFLVVAILDCGQDRLVETFRKKSGLTFLKGLGIILLPVILSLPVLVLGTVLGGEGNISPILARFFGTVVLMIPNLFTVEGGIAMALLGWLFYIFREKRMIQFVAVLAISLLSFRADPSNVQWMMVFSIIPLFFYNGEKGAEIRTSSTFFTQLTFTYSIFQQVCFIKQVQSIS